MDKLGWLTRWRLQGSPTELPCEELWEMPEKAFDLLRKDGLPESFRYQAWVLVRSGSEYMLLKGKEVVLSSASFGELMKTFRAKTRPMTPEEQEARCAALTAFWRGWWSGASRR